MEIIDLTYTIKEGMTTFDAKWHSVVSIKQLGRIGHEGRESREIVFGTHTGTHVDAPLHFLKNGKTIDKIPLERLVGDVSVHDFSHLEANQQVDLKMIKSLKITKRMLFKFGWEKYWDTSLFYSNYPFFSIEAAKYLVSKGLDLIGYDTPSPDDSRIRLGSKEDSQIHKIFLKNNIILVEYLANLNKVNFKLDWKISVNPLKIKNADGSPARVYIFR